MGRIEEIEKRNERRKELRTERKDAFVLLKEVEYQRIQDIAVEDINILLSRLQIAEEALTAFNYYKPLNPQRGRGQAETTLNCGHIGAVGAPCCSKCAVNKIQQALEQIQKE